MRWGIASAYLPFDRGGRLLSELKNQDKNKQYRKSVCTSDCQLDSLDFKLCRGRAIVVFEGAHIDVACICGQDGNHKEEMHNHVTLVGVCPRLRFREKLDLDEGNRNDHTCWGKTKSVGCNCHATKPLLERLISKSTFLIGFGKSDRICEINNEQNNKENAVGQQGTSLYPLSLLSRFLQVLFKLFVDDSYECHRVSFLSIFDLR